MGRSYAARVLSIIKRFTMPILILGALIAALVASNKYGYEDIETLPKSSQMNAELETQIFSIRRAPELLTSPLELEKLAANLGSLMSSVPSNSCLVVAVDGEAVFSEREYSPLSRHKRESNYWSISSDAVGSGVYISDNSCSGA